MSNMNHDAFAQGAMQELSSHDVEQISGGFWPIVGAVIVRSLVKTYGPTVAKAAGVAAGAVVTAVAEFDED
ncbi:MAG: hypothetical protein ABJK59_06100 [Erythrobacter sp.]|uniref:hypothetical protein n=1 Tax=Erythrobacter sp. TaxID=1042 RepID=UPI003297DC16